MVLSPLPDASAKFEARDTKGMEGDIAAVAARTSGRKRLRVYCEEWGKPLIQSQPWVAELVEAAGGEYVGAPGKQTDAFYAQSLVDKLSQAERDYAQLKATSIDAGKVENIKRGVWRGAARISR